jgi:sugar-specific transcriptional regulator TrmB
MIQQTLKELGFNDKEIEVYLEVLRLGRATPAAISRLTGINRATVYSVSKELIKKGVIAGDLGGKSMYLTALPINSLSVLVERQKKVMEKNETLVKQAIEELAKLPMSTQFAIPKIRFIDELDLEEFLYKQINEWNKSMEKIDKILWGFQDHTFVDQYKKWIKDWYNLETSKELKVQLLSNRSETEKQMKKLTPEQRKQREVRFLKKNTNFTATIWVAGEYIIMI